MLVHDVEDKGTFQITEVSPNLYTIQIPRVGETPEQTKNAKKFGRLNRFKYNYKAREEENYINLDVEHTKAFLDSDLVNFLIKQNFDLGIGSSYMANSLLYRLLDLNYIKIEQEDIESYQM